VDYFPSTNMFPKDLNLGNSNLYFTWYALFKEHGAPLVPMSSLPSSPSSFLEAIEFIHYSRDRPIGGQIIKKWVAREGVVRQQPAGTGWFKKDIDDQLRSKRIMLRMPQIEMDKFIDQILKEQGRK
jgi:hypothetical protein